MDMALTTVKVDVLNMDIAKELISTLTDITHDERIAPEVRQEIKGKIEQTLGKQCE